MNKKGEPIDDYRSLRLLDEISRNNDLTQRDLSKNLGVALGLINSYLKNLASKGYITVSTIPRKRYRYYLTPSGFAEKTRLTFRHLHNFTSLYRVARRDFCDLFKALEARGVRKVAFCGIDEVAEIAFLSLSDSTLELSCVFDEPNAGKTFFGMEVLPLDRAASKEFDLAVITSFQNGHSLKSALRRAGVDDRDICDISKGNWLEKIESAAEG